MIKNWDHSIPDYNLQVDSVHSPSTMIYSQQRSEYFSVGEHA